MVNIHLIRGRTVLLALAIVPLGFVIRASLADASSPNYGQVTVSGAIHMTYRLTGPSPSCLTSGSGGLLIELDSQVSNAKVASLFIAQRSSRAPTHSVNLAKTKDYVVSFDAPSGAAWASGWTLKSSKVRKLIHYGSGTLSISRHGKSGTVNTRMTPAHASGIPGKGVIHVTARWHCP